MDPKLLIEINRKELRDSEAQGLTSVSVATLHSIFDKMEQHLGPAEPHVIEIEKFRSDLSASLMYQEHVNSWSLEGFRQVIALGQSSLRSIMLINGGAAVALLAFLGNLITNNSGAAVPSFANAMQAFVLGVFLAAVAYALTYLSQICYNGSKSWQQGAGIALHVLTVLVGAAALIGFLWGSKLAYSGFVSFAP